MASCVCDFIIDRPVLIRGSAYTQVIDRFFQCIGLFRRVSSTAISCCFFLIPHPRRLHEFIFVDAAGRPFSVYSFSGNNLLTWTWGLKVRHASFLCEYFVTLFHFLFFSPQSGDGGMFHSLPLSRQFLHLIDALFVRSPLSRSRVTAPLIFAFLWPGRGEALLLVWT